MGPVWLLRYHMENILLYFALHIIPDSPYRDELFKRVYGLKAEAIEQHRRTWRHGL